MRRPSAAPREVPTFDGCSLQQVQRRVNVGTAAGWRDASEGEWESTVLDLMRSEIPGFGAWYDPDPTKRASGTVPRLKGKAKKEFLAKTTTQGWQLALLLASQTRALNAAQPPGPPTRKSALKLAKGVSKVLCYTGVYTRYLIQLLTEGTLPRRNDSGDIELFLYAVDDDWIVVTGEKKWVKHCQDAGFGTRVRRI